MSVLHLADMHYGYRQYGYREREQDFYDAGSHAVKRAIDLKVSCVVLSGDIFDSPKPPASAVEALQEQVTELRNAGIVVAGIDGNHDASAGKWLKVCGIHDLDAPKPLEVTQADGTAIKVWGLRYYRPSVFKEKLEAMAASGEQADVFAIHQSIGEMADFDGGEVTALEMAPLMRKIGVKYVAMGDIHVYKETVIGGIRFAYPGSMELNAIDEATEKLFLTIEMVNGEARTTMNPLETRRIEQLYLEGTEDIDALLADIKPGDGAKLPMVIIWYEPDAKTLTQRAEEILKARKILYRTCPLTSGSQGTLAQRMAQQSFDRKSALGQLQSAVVAYFEEDSDQYQLVFQLLKSPDNVSGIFTGYLKSKGVEL